MKSGKYKILHIDLIRGLPQPFDDRYYSQILFLDPVHTV